MTKEKVEYWQNGKKLKKVHLPPEMKRELIIQSAEHIGTIGKAQYSNSRELMGILIGILIGISGNFWANAAWESATNLEQRTLIHFVSAFVTLVAIIVLACFIYFDRCDGKKNLEMREKIFEENL